MNFTEKTYAEVKQQLNVQQIGFILSEDKKWYSKFLNNSRTQVSFHADLKAQVKDTTMFLVKSYERMSKKGSKYMQIVLCNLNTKADFTA